MSDPRAEFAQVLRDMGGIVDNGHPIMDGKQHRLATHEDKRGERAIFYVAHLDGVPNGYAENNRTKEIVRWKANTNGQRFDEQIKAEIAKAKAERARAQTTLYETTAERLANLLRVVGARADASPYHERKGIAQTAGAPVRNGVVLVPGYDLDGKLWTIQYIAADGTKRFAKDSRKHGCFHVVGVSAGPASAQQVKNASLIVIAEGYATAAAIAQHAGMTTVAAFDSGNILPVASAIKTRYSGKQIVVAGDDDHRLPNNPGRAKAIEAAQAVKGCAVFPWLSRRQRAERLTDFNDLPPETLLTQFGALVKQIGAER
jgi:putative DNA primase/helicase